MSKKDKFQVHRDADKRWLIWKVGDSAECDGKEFEQVARIVEDGGRYFVELPVWGTDGIDKWDRQPRPWALKDGAVHSVTHPTKKALAS